MLLGRHFSFLSLLRTRAPGRSPRCLCLCTDGATAPAQAGGLLGGGGTALRLKGVGGGLGRAVPGGSAQNTGVEGTLGVAWVTFWGQDWR